MSEEEAIKEMNKVERIFKKLSKNGYSVNIKESMLIMCTDEQEAIAIERIDKIHWESKEWGVKEEETLHIISF